MSSRRGFLSGLTVGVVGGLAGCIGGVSEVAREPFDDNPVARNVEERPRRGPPRSDSTITLVAFDDPSCPACAELHEGAGRKIESEWIATGRATHYRRMRPTVADWGRPAFNAILEAAERAPGAYPVLAAAYYEHQDSLNTGNVVEKTGEFLTRWEESSERRDDVAAITDAAETRPYADRIDTDAEIADEAGINGVPTVFLFVEGEFVTTLGSDRFDAYRSAVESHA